MAVKPDQNMGVDGTEECDEQPILYELLEYYVRKQEPELSRCKNDTAAILPATGTIKIALRYLNNRYSLPESISFEIGLTLQWKFAVGDKGSLLAILQDNLIEIRKSKDEYSSVVGKASVPKDAFPQWRKVVWSPDCSLLVVASSNGYLSFYNSLGNNVFNISPKNLSQNPNILEAGDAVASMIFVKTRVKSLKWAYEFLVITYSGLLKAYYVSATEAFEESHEFSFGSLYRNGVSAVAYNDRHNLLFVAGSNITQNLHTISSKSGLTSWRILNDYPYYKLSFANEESTGANSSFSIWNYLPTLHSQIESVIFKNSISPNGDLLACLHTDGSITIWNLPSLRLHKKWGPNEQPDADAVNPLGLVKLRKLPPGFSEFHPIDVNWWSNHSVIIARYCGSVSVCSIKNLRNLLGASPEFLYGQPQISELCPDRGFLSLDCETFLTSKKRSRDSTNESQNSDSSSESEKEEEENERPTALKYAGSLFQSALYSITDMERFQPKRKKSKLIHRTYRILGLKSTTPEELYSRKIDIEEYGEALALANTYNLDTDLVYQTQWRKSEFSLNAIKNHLSKVSKRSWVLNECVTRVPDTIEASRELLNFGLGGANLETLLAIGVKDDGKFTPADIEDEDYEELDKIGATLRQIQKENQILDQINIEKLTEGQKEMVMYRRKLLDHLDKLQTYEIILEAPSMYNKIFYEEFRKLSALQNAIRFAKDSNYRAVDIMFTYHSAKILPHWLAVISFFPETLKPTDYEKLLPECDNEGQLFLPDQLELRQKDWSEKSEFSKTLGLSDDDGSELIYDCDPALRAYRNVPLTQELLKKWYKSRAYQIERNSSIVDNALSLIRIGKSRNIKGLENFMFELETLDDLIYKVNMEDMSLARLEKLSDLDKIRLLMSKSDEKNFVDNIKNLVIPYIHRKERLSPQGCSHQQLLHDYLVSLSEDDLTLPVKFFEHLKQTQNTEIIRDLEAIMKLALDCIYSCKDLKMYEKAKCIFECIPFSLENVGSGKICCLIEELEQELECLRVLSEYNVKTTLKYIQENKTDRETIKMLLTQMARYVNELPPSEKLWPQLLNDILQLHETTFSCLDIEVCFEICVSARLTSGDKTTIQNCTSLIETKKSEKSMLKVPYDKAVELVLQASTEYFNSSKSLTDSSMELAKACLYLIEDDNPAIKEEYELISSLQILNDFNVNVLPLQVRLSQDRIKLIESCLNNQEDAYKSTQRLLNLARYLRIEKYNSRNRDGKVLELVAQKAYEVRDYSACATICQQLIDQNSSSAWKIVFDLGNDDEYQDFKFRQKCLSFAMNCGPTDLLETLLQRMHLIEIQILHKDLQNLLPSEVSDTMVDSDDEFTDAMTTPQVESKEFLVPNIIGTSTEMVISSAELVKKSTYSLLKNVGNRNFWKNTLNLNFVTQSSDSCEADDQILKLDTVAKNPQSFSCFYESLHRDCSISSLDTNYAKYSLPDIKDKKFKLCQNLVRVALLGECASYGFESSSIDHLFVECARHVFTEDCLLGISYLLSLSSSDNDFVRPAFDDIPDADLRLQLAAYFYSLELYKKLEPDKVGYYYDPLELISRMTKAAANMQDCPIAEGLIYWSSRLLNAKDYEAEDELADLESEQNPTDNSNPVYESKRQEEKSCTQLEASSQSRSLNKKSFDKFSIEVSSFESNEEETGWDDDWGDFSDPSDEDEKNAVEKSERRELVSSGTEMTEGDRFAQFENLVCQVSSKDEYLRMKEKLISWPTFENPEFTTVDKHPALRLIDLTKVLVTEENDGSTSQRLVECKEIMAHQIVSETVLRKYLSKKHVSSDLELNIYLHLRSNQKSLQEEAVQIIKEKYQDMKLSPPILQELFFKNLTGSFHPNHIVYKLILDEVIDNFDLVDIEENLKILSDVLVVQRCLPQAAALRNFINGLPRSLQTFDAGLGTLFVE
ncbi:NBAS subunit of NRZ tethering complex [Neodiprion pinetum]|uniref:NBAS subunit of NRZ tethering complex n=1 Tax=Neodiprion pinetum TaxID=441929 RepID=UPI001EDF8CB1|nr:neuroblastoma-amplified sequence-like [Neodiprion pinetum]XP_046481060.1 neuroblastoma-amplified sequence-like [Neodiprion pinetum]XP_046481061.1 neuroblastoma-amplified sequence-like [Neodiprion pinetum]